MKILSIECSAGPASCAIIEDGRIIANTFVNTKLTHSQTLIPMIINTLNTSLLTIDNIDKIAIAVGPGSFTGIRIGISAVKGIAAPKKIPCIPVSTLAGMAEMFNSENSIVCAVMDARCNQLYNALFDVSSGNVKRLCDDRAIMCDDLALEIEEISREKKVIICGDGSNLFFPYVEKFGCICAQEHLKYQNAIGIGLYAEKNSQSHVEYQKLLPTYLRLPQAERELKAKKQLEMGNLK